MLKEKIGWFEKRLAWLLCDSCRGGKMEKVYSSVANVWGLRIYYVSCFDTAYWFKVRYSKESLQCIYHVQYARTY